RVYISDCQDKLGKLVAARDTLQAVIDEKLAEYAPDSFRKAQNDARERLVALDKRIPTVTIALQGADGASLELDGKTVPQESVGQPIRVDPGSHTVAATGADGRGDKKTFKVEESGRAKVTLVVPGSATTTTTTTDVPDPDATGEKPSGGRSYIPSAVAFGVGGAGVLLGAIAGGLFVARADELKDACANDGDGDDQTCPDEGEIDKVKVLGNVATAGWVIAGVGTVAGVILLFVPSEDDSEDDEKTTVRVTPTGLSIQGRF
ncbi:MAG TPA: hypothetical protein VFB62_16240, partial [Polyangiaceae bacterium]|nr:hypothetical protein [Polyangiaceae bacterium]